jgi:hydroxymethylbilane synthase
VTRAVNIGTRGSPLALVQAHAVAERLRQRGVESTIIVIATAGDDPTERVTETDGKRLFVKEIQDALLAEQIDLAVHSSKDMPATSPDGLRIVATLPREDARDAIVLPGAGAPPGTLAALVAALGAVGARGPRPRIGTSSVRRIAQLTTLFPDAAFLPVRGNLGTRLQKLDAGDYDAIVLAAAGLRRLQREDRISGTVPIEHCVPAPGQGIIAVESRVGDREVHDAVVPIGDHASAIALAAEQAVVRRLLGGCQMPIGAYAELDGPTVTLRSVVISLDGTRVARAITRGQASAADRVGFDAATELLARGADAILADVQRGRAAGERESS